MPLTSKAAPVVIVGAGVFGLSSALHLAERGYTNVTILDRQAYHENEYSHDRGCDGASSDINKIIRAAYGAQTEYQALALDALEHWKAWNAEIAGGGVALPPGWTPSDAVYINNGNLTMTSDESLPQFEHDTIRNMTAAGLARTQIVLSNPADVARARANGFGFAVNPFRRHTSRNFGLLDTQGGFVYADRACIFALHKARTLGIRVVLGDPEGSFAGFLTGSDGAIAGVRTADGAEHLAELTIMACGGWTPSLVPELDNLCETTAGSVCVWQLRPGTPAWDRFSPDNFPTWTYDIRNGKHGGLYGFARDAHGAVKIGYRGTKFTNPQPQADGVARSVPTTRWTPQPTRRLPALAARVIGAFVSENLPELMACEMKTRLCWYTDSFDNHFVIDFVPGASKGLMVATGGSGHGFKFLPTLGRYVVDRIEGRESIYLTMWRWRSLEAGRTPYNSIMEGIASENTLQNQAFTAEDSLAPQEGQQGRQSRL